MHSPVAASIHACMGISAAPLWSHQRLAPLFNVLGKATLATAGGPINNLNICGSLWVGKQQQHASAQGRSKATATSIGPQAGSAEARLVRKTRVVAQVHGQEISHGNLGRHAWVTPCPYLMGFSPGRQCKRAPK